MATWFDSGQFIGPSRRKQSDRKKYVLSYIKKKKNSFSRVRRCPFLSIIEFQLKLRRLISLLGNFSVACAPIVKDPDSEILSKGGGVAPFGNFHLGNGFERRAHLSASRAPRGASKLLVTAGTDLFRGFTVDARAMRERRGAEESTRLRGVLSRSVSRSV